MRHDTIEPPRDVVASVARLDRQIRALPRIAAAVAGAGVVVGGWGLFQFDARHLGDFGQFVGGTVGALWSLAGLVLIYVAFLGQRRQLQLQEEELRLTRVDLRETRTELQGQKKALEEQGKTARQQQFDSTFFQLLRLHGEILTAIKIEDTYGVHTGRQAFRHLYELYRQAFDFYVVKDPAPRERAYADLYGQYGDEIGHYFRNLYHIMKFIDQNTPVDRNRYAAFVRAQLSTNELLLLFYNCLSEYGVEKFKPLVEAYTLFKTLDRSKLASKDHWRLYEPSAFRNS